MAISLIIGIKIATFEYIIFIENNEETDTISAVDIFVIIKSVCQPHSDSDGRNPTKPLESLRNSILALKNARN